MRNNYKVFITVLLILIIISVYYPVLNFEYIWDDTLLFVGKTSLLTEPLSWALISEPVLPGTTYFRPLVFLSWYIEFNLLGQSSAISHFIGLCIFSLNSCLVFALAYLLKQSTGQKNVLICAFLATLFYILHPALIESTAWVSGRFDQFCTFFILLACFLFLKNLKPIAPLSVIKIILISICFFAALLSKELGLVLPVILFLLQLILLQKKHDISQWQNIKNTVVQHKALWLALCIVLLVYFILRLKMMNAVYHAPLTTNYFQDAILNNWLPLHTLVFYIQQTFLPFSSISILHPYEEWQFTDVLPRIKALIALGLIIVMLWAAWVKRSVAAWLGCIALCTLILVLNIIPLGTSGNIGHERFMTLGLAFVAISLVFLPYQQVLSHFKIQTKTQKLIFSLVLSGWFVLCLASVKSILPLWTNDYTLWGWTYKLHPESGIARYNYLYGALKKSQNDEVIQVAEAYSKKHNGLEVADQMTYAMALINTGQKEGLDYLEGAIYALPKFHESKSSEARRNADNFRITAGQMASAYTSYAIGQLMYNADVEKAKKYLKIAEWYLLPTEKETLNYQLAAVLFIEKKYDEAIKLFNNNLEVSKKTGSNRYNISAQIMIFYCQNEKADKEVCLNFDPDVTFKLH